MATTAFRGMKPFPQLMFSIFIMVASVTIFMVVGMLIAIPFWGINVIMNGLTAAGSDPAGIHFLKYFQVIQSIGLFVVPPFIIAFLYHGNINEYLQISRSTRWQSYLLATVALIAATPAINFLGEINGQMKLPEFMSGLESWMREMEDKATVLVELFMKVSSIPALLFNIFMIAIIPALGEELMFRGVIQRIFSNWTKNYHWGIWITAFLFSAMHMQFYGFIPRMLLGAMFGYLLVWTGTLWVPILAHFVNNTLGVIGYFLINKGVMTKEDGDIGAGIEQFPVAILSLAAVGILLFLLYRSERLKIKMPVNRSDSQASRID